MFTGTHMYARTYLQGTPCQFLQDMDAEEEKCQEEEEKMVRELSVKDTEVQNTKGVANSIVTGFVTGMFAMPFGALICSSIPILLIGGVIVGVKTIAYCMEMAKEDGPFWRERQVRLVYKLSDLEERIQNPIETDEIDQLKAVWWGFKWRSSALQRHLITTKVKTCIRDCRGQLLIDFEKLPREQWK